MNDWAEQKINSYLEAVAARSPTPGGGSVAATVAAEGCALMKMVASFSEGELIPTILEEASAAIGELLTAGQADQEAFESVMQSHGGKGDKQAALVAAASVPASIIHICADRLEHLEYLAAHGNVRLLSDVAIAALLLDSAVRASEINILINLREAGQVQDEKIAKALELLPDVTARLQSVATTARQDLS